MTIFDLTLAPLAAVGLVAIALGVVTYRAWRDFLGEGIA